MTKEEIEIEEDAPQGENPELTIGQHRVGISFNPSNNEMVGKIKATAAELIDLIATIRIQREPDTGEPTPFGLEVKRLAIIAQDQIESAAMFAVKAATKR